LVDPTLVRCDGAIGPIEGMGLQALEQGCAEAGLTRAERPAASP
jgi:hypothetical protein